MRRIKIITLLLFSLLFPTLSAQYHEATMTPDLAALKYYNEGNYPKALEQFNRAVTLNINKGDALAYLSEMYAMGKGVEKDLKKAAELSQESANLNNEKGYAILGIYYYNGWGVPQDYSLAMENFRKGAERKNSLACNKLAFMYYYGIGTQQSWENALKWYIKGADLGDTESQKMAGLMLSAIDYEGHDYAKGHQYLIKAANAGDNEARTGLFDNFRLGINSLTEEEALGYVKAASDAGSGDASYNIAAYLISTDRDGTEYFLRAVDQGSVLAYAELGLCYYQGDNSYWKFVTQNYDKAFHYLSAIENKIGASLMTDQYKSASLLALSRCYRMGRGVKADIQKADDLMKRAAIYADPTSLDIRQILQNGRTNQ